MKWVILAGMILILGLSSLVFSTGKFCKNVSSECGFKRVGYPGEREEIFLRYQNRVIILNSQLNRINEEIRIAKIQNNSNALTRLTNERDKIAKEIEYEHNSINDKLPAQSEEEKKYIEIVSRYEKQIDILNDRLAQIEKKISAAQIRRDVLDLKRFTTEREMIKRDIEYEHELFNSELKRNNLTHWHYK